MKLVASIASRAAFVTVVVAVAPKIAAACPYCAQNTPDSSAFYWLIVSMILLPFAVAGLVIYFIRRIPKAPSALAPERVALTGVEASVNHQPRRES